MGTRIQTIMITNPTSQMDQVIQSNVMISYRKRGETESPWIRQEGHVGIFELFPEESIEISLPMCQRAAAARFRVLWEFT
jgi:hypothetical protein